MTINPNARNRSPRASLALALEPRILLDAAAVTTAADVAAKVDASANAPGVEATPTKSTVTIKDSTDSFGPVNLFDNIKVSLDSSSEQPTEISFQVSSSGSNQALVIDGEQIVLQNGLSGTTPSFYAWSVKVENGISTVTVNLQASGAEVTAERVQTLLDTMSYKALDKTVESGTVTITINSLTDDGGQSADLSAIKASVTIDNQVNVAPVLSDSGALDSRETYSASDLGIGAGSEVAWSADGRFAYVAGGSGVQVFSVSDSGALTRLQTYSDSSLGTIADMVISADGKSIYTHSGGTAVTLLTVGEDGQISASTAYSAQNGSISGSLAVSADGQYVYAGTDSNDVVVFTRDIDSGALTVFTRAMTTGNNRGGVIATSGEFVFVLYKGSSDTPPTLAVYQHDAEGKLPQQLTNISIKGLTNNSTSDSLIVAPDGKTLYISDPTTGQITVVSFDGSVLTTRGSISMTGVSGLAISADGSQLYATASNGTLNVYQVDANGNLTLSSSQTGNTTGKDIALAANGSLLVAGDSVTRYSSVQALNLGQASTFAENLTLRDANFEVSGNYKGTRIIVDPSVSGGSFGLDSGNGLTLDSGTIKLNGNAIGTLSVGADGTLTVTLTADTSKAVANQVLQQLTYSAASGTAADSLVTLQVSVSDGLLASGVLSLTLRANSVPVGNVGGYTPPKATSETAYSTELPDTLFSDADGDALVWSVSGLPAGLSFDHLTRTISGTTTATGDFTVVVTATDASGQKASVELTLDVEQIANRAPELNPAAADTVLITVGAGNSVTLDQAMFSDKDSGYGDTLTWSVTGLPSDLEFDPVTRTISGTTSATSDTTIKVTVTDGSGTTASTELTLRVISQAEADNSKPVLDVDSSTLVYSNNTGLSGFSDYVYSVEVSSDGRTVFVLGNSSAGHAIEPGGSSTLYLYSRNPDTGVLTLIQKIRQGTSDDGDAANGIEVDGLNRAASAVYSADGKQVYLVGQKAAGGNYAVTVFNVNADGTLTATGQSVDAGATQIKQMTVAQDGTLYAVAGSTLLVFKADTNGALAVPTVITDSTLNPAYGVATDSHGSVFVLGSSRLVVYEADGQGGLTRSAEITQGLTSYNRNLVVSDSGYIYVAAAIPGSVQAYHYDSASNTLVRIASVTTAAQTWGVALSADGKTLYAGSFTGSLYIFRIESDGKPVFVKQLDGMSGRGFRIAVSEDGESIYAGGFAFAGGLANISISDAAQLDYTEGQSAVIHPGANLGVSDVELDAAGNYNGAVITLQREGAANTDDVFDFTTGNGLSRVGDTLQLNGTPIATLTSADGKITITFTADTTKAVANQVLRQISYANTSNDPGASVSLNLNFQDQYKSGTTSRELVVVMTTVNDAPTATATPVDSVQEPGKDSVPLFTGSTLDTVEAGQTITALTFTVSGLKDGASETLTLDGTAIALVSGSGVTAGGLSYTVTLSGETATVLLASASGITGSAAAAVVDGARYAHSDSKATTLGERTVTLSTVKDSGGTANGGADTTTVNLQAKVNVSRESPVLGSDPGTLEVVEKMLSNSWPDAYAGIDSVVTIGDQVYALRSTSDYVYDEATGTYPQVTFSTLYVFTRNSDGTLTLRDTVNASADNGLSGATTRLGLSADGNSVYFTTSDNRIAVFSRDADSGALTALGTFAGSIDAIDRVLVNGNTAYLSNGTSLTVFTRAGSVWSQGATLTPGNSEAAFTQLQLSADGKFLYVGNTGGNTVVSLYSVAADGALTLVEHLAGSSGAHYIDALTLSADGKTLYVADDKTLYSLKVGADGKLSANTDTVTLDKKPSQLLTSADGTALIAVGTDAIAMYSLKADGTLGASRSFSIAELNRGTLTGATLSEDGKQLYLTGAFDSSGALVVINLVAQPSTFTERGDAVAVLPDGTLHDPQLDLLASGTGDYKDASIVIQRDGGASTNDVFSLLPGSGLTLNNTNQIVLNGVAIATFEQTNGVLTLTFITSVSQANAQLVLRNISYANTSKDPASSATLNMVLNDGEGYSTSRLVDVNLIAVNDTPVASTVGLNPIYVAETEPVKLFEDTQIDLIEADQLAWQLVLTISPPSQTDIISVDGGKIYLSGDETGVLTSATGLQYQVQRGATSTQLVLFVMSSAERAQEIVNSLTYSNSGDNKGDTSRTISLSVRDTGGGADLGVATGQTVITLQETTVQNTAPVLSGGATTVGYTEQAEPVLLAPGTTISDTQMDAFNTGKGNYGGAVISVTLGAGHTSSDQLAFKEGNGLSLSAKGELIKNDKVIGQLTLTDGALTLRFSDDAGEIPTTADVNNALHQITYANSSDAPVASVAVTIRLTDQRGLAAADRALTLNITAVNDAPTLTPDPLLSIGDLERVQDLNLSSYGLATPTGSVVSADGLRVYIADGQGHIALFSRDDSGALTHLSTLTLADSVGKMQLSADGKNLYALRSDGSAILCFGADAQGNLTLQATVISDYEVDASALFNLHDISLQADGKTLFLLNGETVLQLSRDPATGKLTYVGALPSNMSDEPWLWQPTEMTSRGDLLFVVTNTSEGSSLLVYRVGSDGSVTQIAYTREGAGALDGLQQVSVSADGKTVYVASDSQVSHYSFDSTRATLTYQGSVLSTGISDVAVSADGTQLFVTLQDGTVNRYASNHALAGALQVAGAGKLLVTDNGVLLLGTGASVIGSEAKPGPSLAADDRTPAALAPSLTLSDPELDFADSYQGASLTISGQASDSIGLLPGGSYSLNGSNVLLDGNVVATLVRDGNVTTLTFTAALTRTQATALVRQLSWTSNADTPAQASSHALTLVLNDGDSGGTLASNSFNVEVTLLPANMPPVLGAAYSDYALKAAEAGKGYQLQLPADLFSDPEGEALTYSISDLPSGMHFDPITRILSGTAPREVGSISLTLKVSDASGTSTTLVLELAVANSLPVADSGYQLPGVSTGQPYDVQLPESLFSDANDDSLSWQVVGDLPEWLSFDAATHTFSGTAPDTAGSYSITLRADDGQGGVTEVTLTLVVASPVSNGVAPVISTAAGMAMPLALSTTQFEVEERPATALDAGNDPAFQPTSDSVRHSAVDDGGLASARGTLAAQLANADRIVTDTGFQAQAEPQVHLDGKTLRAEVDLGSHDGRWVSLRVPLEVADGASVQRVTLANGLPLPSWASFDARSGEIRIDSRYLQRHGEVRLSLTLRDADGREQRMPLHIRAQGDSRSEPRADTAEAPATLSQQLGQQASGSLYTEAMDLLEQLGEWANDDFQHIA